MTLPNRTDYVTILQNLVNQICEIQISLKILATDTQQVLRWKKNYKFVLSFDGTTGKLRTIAQDETHDSAFFDTPDYFEMRADYCRYCQQNVTS